MQIESDHSDAGTSDLATAVASAALILWMSGLSLRTRDATYALYTLGYWHYQQYALAFFYGATSPFVFRRDATLMKAVALAGLSCVYLSYPIEPVSVVVVSTGFGLNALAAWVLGWERTYYGREIAGLPEDRVTSFPFSWVRHPMLIGNVLGFGGTLIHGAFRTDWWPLAVLHVGFNLFLIVLEDRIVPRHRHAEHSRGEGWSTDDACAAAMSAGFAMLVVVVTLWNSNDETKRLDPWRLAALSAAAFPYALLMERSYSGRCSTLPRIRPIPTERE